MNYSATRQASGTYPRGKEAPPSPARRWLGRALLAAAMMIAANAAWLPAKAALAQQLLHSSWQSAQADGGAHRPWPWADTHAVAKLVQPRLGISQVVLAGDSGRPLAFKPGNTWVVLAGLNSSFEQKIPGEWGMVFMLP